MRALAILAVLGAAACGGSPSAVPDLAAFEQAANEVSAASASHRAASASFSGEADCQAERGRYEGRMRPLLDVMEAMSADADDCMSSMGHDDAPTMVEQCTSMRSELERHLDVACSSVDMAKSAAEAASHADRMQGWAQGEVDRAERMRAMMSGTGMMSGGCHM